MHGNLRIQIVHVAIFFTFLEHTWISYFMINVNILSFSKHNHLGLPWFWLLILKWLRHYITLSNFFGTHVFLSLFLNPHLDSPPSLKYTCPLKTSKQIRLASFIPSLKCNFGILCWMRDPYIMQFDMTLYIMRYHQSIDFEHDNPKSTSRLYMQ